MPRKRSFLFDSGTLYAQIDVVANANSVSTIAGGNATRKLKSIEIKPYGSVVQAVTGTNEWYLNNNIIVTSIIATLRGPSNVAPQGRDMIVVIKKNNVNFATITITKATTSKVIDYTNTSPLFAYNGDKLTFDVTQPGLTTPGSGLKLDITYY